MSKTEIILISSTIVFQCLHLILIIWMTIDAMKELKQTLERSDKKCQTQETVKLY